MITLNLITNQTVAVAGSDVLRVRSGDEQYDPHGTKCLVVWAEVLCCTNDTQSVVSAVAAEQGSKFVSLQSPGFGPIWFDGSKAAGPLYVPKVERRGGIQSSFEIGGKRQYVNEPPETVRDTIIMAHGTVLPIINDPPDTASISMDRSHLDLPVWDADYFLRGNSDQ